MTTENGKGGAKSAQFVKSQIAYRNRKFVAWYSGAGTAAHSGMTKLHENAERFSNRVENYVKYRPTYPREVLELFKEKMGLTSASIVADIGSGPGISARLFLENGNTVYGVEPNNAMRAAAERLLSDLPNFRSVNGTAENTTLENSSVDFVMAAQAFHWFDREKARQEFRRILRSGGGYIVLIWNERQLDSTPFLIEYEEFVLKHGRGYPVVPRENISGQVLGEFFGSRHYQASFENVQVLNFEGLKGRMLSASYMPAEADDNYGETIDDLAVLFKKHAAQGKIEIIYDTNIYYAQV